MPEIKLVSVENFLKVWPGIPFKHNRFDGCIYFLCRYLHDLHNIIYIRATWGREF